MCWNLTASLASSGITFAIAALLAARPRNVKHRFYAAAIVGICAMQLSEAFLWYHGDLAEHTCKLGGANRFGMQVLIRLALLLQPMGAYLGLRSFLVDPEHKPGFLYSTVLRVYPVFPIFVNGLMPMRYLLLGDNYTCDDVNIKIVCHHMCARLTPSGLLNWNAAEAVALWELLIWFAYNAVVPFMALRFREALALSSYGLICLLTSWAFTDSAGSHWCLYVTGYALLALAEWSLCGGDRIPPRVGKAKQQSRRQKVEPIVGQEKIVVQLFGEWIDVTNFQAKHPGGSDILSWWNGKDGTEAFEAIHPSEKARNMLKLLPRVCSPVNAAEAQAENTMDIVGINKDDNAAQRRNAAINKEWRALLADFRSRGLFNADPWFVVSWMFTCWAAMFVFMRFLWGPYMNALANASDWGDGLLEESSRTHAPLPTYNGLENVDASPIEQAKLIGILQGAAQNYLKAVLLRVFRVQIAVLSLLPAALIGFFLGQLSFIMHLLGHAGVVGGKKWDHFFQHLIMNVSLGDTAWGWNTKHWLHHAQPNVHQRDPDVHSTIFWDASFADVAWPENSAPHRWIMPFQHKCAYFYYSLYGHFRHVKAWMVVLGIVQVQNQGILGVNGPIEKKRGGPLWTETLWTSAHYVCAAAIFSASGMNLLTFLGHYLTAFSVVGLYIGTVSVLNHHHHPVKYVDEDSETTWVELASCNTDFESSLLCSVLTGFGNVHIEHHLCPSMPSQNYPKIQKDVKIMFQKFDIPYNQQPFWSVLRESNRLLREAAMEFDRVAQHS
jgi:fatty acid desaturase